MAVCEKCSMEKVDNKRICDLCYVKFQEPKVFLIIKFILITIYTYTYIYNIY